MFRINFTYQKWIEAVNEFLKYTRKTLPQVLNHQAGYIAYQAFLRTPRMNANQKRNLFFTPQIKMRVQKKSVRLRYNHKAEITKYGWRIVYKTAPEIKNIMRNKSMPFEQRLEETYRAGAKILNRKLSASGYTRSGWIPAIREFIRRNPDSRFKFYGNPFDLGGYKKANETEQNPVAIIENKTKTAAKIAGDALTMAFAAQTEFLRREIIRRMQNAR